MLLAPALGKGRQDMAATQKGDAANRGGQEKAPAASAEARRHFGET